MNPDGAVLLNLGPLSDPESVHPNLAAVGDGSYLLSLFMPLDALANDPPKVVELLGHILGDILNLHVDPRGVLIVPDTTPQATDYEGVVAELAEQGFWALPAPEEIPAVAPGDPVPPAKARGATVPDADRLVRVQKPIPEAPELPPQSQTADPEDPTAVLRQELAGRYDGAAEELAVASGHLRQAASYFREGDVPRACAHRLSAEGHLARLRTELDSLAILHAEHSPPPTV